MSDKISALGSSQSTSYRFDGEGIQNGGPPFLPVTNDMFASCLKTKSDINVGCVKCVTPPVLSY